MELLEQEVKKTLELNSNSQYYLYYGTSPDNIHFAILATKGLWYKLNVFANLDGRQIDITKYPKLETITHFTKENLANLFGFPNDFSKEQKISQGHTEHTTEEGVNKRIEECKAEIENGLYNSVFPVRLTHKFEKNFYFQIVKQPVVVITNPDEHLQLGDIISNGATPPKYGVYVGSGEVVYSPSANDKPVVGKICPDFIHSEDTIVEKLVFPFKLREPEKIVEIAKSFVNTEYQQEEYKLLFEQPQNFVTRSAIGLELPLGQGIIQTLLKKLHM